MRHWVVAIFGFGLLLNGTAFGASYPLRASANGRYLVDQNNAPFLVVGDAPHSLLVNVSEAEAAFYLADRGTNGFNSLWVELLCVTYTGGRSDGSMLDGTRPFTGNLPTGAFDLTTPNEAYFSHVDRILALAATNGLQILLDPLDTGGLTQAALDNGTNRCRWFGQYLGNRYKNFPNILWLNGNDFQSWKTPANDAAVQAVALGIRDADTNHLQTVQLDYPTSGSLDDNTWAPLIGFNAAYTYFPTYAQVLEEYYRSNFLPVILLEAHYEFENLWGDLGTALVLRHQEYWAMLSGAAGQLYGNAYTWPFLGGWPSHLDSVGVKELQYMACLFKSRGWYDLVPDPNHLVLTSGYGTYASTGSVSANDYATAARTADGHTVIIYVPTRRTLGVDLSKISGTSAKAWWFDPQSGVATNFGLYATTGSQNFTPPDANDWVLVLDDAAVAFAPPGVGGGPLQVNTSALPEAAVGVPYSTQLKASGGTEPYSWSLTTASDPLPGGLVLSASGLLAGIPAIESTNAFVVQVVDSTSSASATQILSLLVAPLDTVAPSMPTGLVAVAAGSSQVELTWNPASDDIGVTGYLVEASEGSAGFALVASVAEPRYSHTGLNPNTLYNYRVRATDAVGNLSDYSMIASTTTLTPDTTAPSIPSGVTAVAASKNRIDLSWEASSDDVGVMNYLLERSQGPDSTSFTQVGNPVTTDYADTDLTPDTVYNYRVRTADASGNVSGYSSVASTRTMAGIPGLVAAYSFDEGTGTTVRDASGNGNTGVIGGATWTTAGKYGSGLAFNGSSARVTVSDSSSLQLTSAMTLEAWVKPSTVSSAWRDVIFKGDDNYYLEATSGSGGRPAAGGTFSASPLYGPTALSVNAWAHLAATYDGATLRLYVNAAQVASRAQTGQMARSTNPLQIGGDSLYGQYFQGTIDEVRVYNVALTQAQILADANAPISPDTTPPTAPSGVTAAAASTNQINLSWSASADNVGITGYLVERSEGAGELSFAQVGSASGTSYTNTGLKPSTVYNYRVRATDAAGNRSDYSAVVSATTPALPDTTPPTAPSGITAAALSTNQINLSWNASADNVAVTGYLVERSEGAGGMSFAQVGSVSGTSYTNAGLKPGTLYNYRVRAMDAAGNRSDYSVVVSATTQALPDTTPPTAPSGVTAAAVSTNQINLSWSASADNVGVTGYLVECSEGADGMSFAQIGNASGTSYTNTGLRPSTVYNYRVRAMDAAGNRSDYSAVVSATTPALPDTTPPTAPSGVTAAAVSTNQINLNWNASADNVAVTGYLVERSEGAGGMSFAQVGSVSGTSYTNAGLKPSTLYNYRVRAMDAAGNRSDYSVVASASTPAAPDKTPPTAPTTVVASATRPTQITVSWKPSTDNVAVTGYRIERRIGAGRFSQVATTSGLIFNDVGLSSRTTYSYRVRATDAAGNVSAYSNTASAKTR